MDRSAGQLQAFFKATLLGLVLLSMVTLAPHVCSCLRTFLFVSIPSAASAVATPKCLFVFSNIIVVFLATESKLSRTGAGDDQSQSCEEIDVVGDHQQQLTALVHVIKENYADQKIVKAEQEALHQVVRCEQKDDASSSSTVFEQERDDVLLVHDGDACDMELVEELGRADPDEEVIDREECDEEEMGLPTDELNKKVEDFIARFNMERQLEARMLVCCC